ncbi:hypothetical protein JST97_18075 [bacterium]|nr:hypothetical protein [bacterium]
MSEGTSKAWIDRGYWLPALVLTAVTIVYSNHFQNEFVFDDLHAVVDNLYIRDWHNIPRMFWDARMITPLRVNQSYRPLVPVSLAIDFALGGGLYPFYFHITTFLAFLLQLVCMARLVELVVGSRRRAWLGVAVYGLHPVATQTVNYICQRAEVYVSLGLCLGVWLYARGRPGRAMLAFLMASLFKQNGVVFTGLLVSYEYFLGGRNWRKVLPFVLLTLIILAWMAFRNPPHMDLGGVAPRFYWITQPYVLMLYIRAFFMPSVLVGDQEMLPFLNPLEPGAILGMLGLTVFLIIMFRSRPVIGFAMSWFLISQSPTLLVPFSDLINDHRMYGPYVAVAIIVAELASNSRRQLLVLGLLPLLGLASHARNRVWHNLESFWAEVTVKCPDDGRAWMNYALCQVDKGQYEDALDCLMRAQPLLSDTFSPVYLNFGLVFGRLHNIKAAEENFKKAIEVDAGSTPWYVYGDWLVEQHRWGEAVLVLRRALKINPGDERPHYALRSALMEATRLAKKEKSASAYTQVAMIYYLEGQYAKALEAAKEASRMDPNDPSPLVNQSACLMGLKRWDEAARAAEKALELQPGLASAKENLLKSRFHLTGLEK